MKEIIIVGAGGHAAEIRDYIDHLNAADEDEKIIVKGFIDDNESNYQQYGFSEPYLGLINGHQPRKDVRYICGIANLRYRRSIVEELISKGAGFTGFIHPAAIVSPSATIGEGVIVSHSVSIGPKVKIGDYCIVNSRCTIGHDTEIGDFNFISPQVALSGHTHIGNNNMLGVNSCTIPGIKIGNNNIIAAGMVLHKDVGDEETVFYRYKERMIIRKEE